MSSDSPLKLAYFNGKGLAETSRLLFAATETPFEDFRYPISVIDGKYIRDEFTADKHTFPMGQVPVLTVTNKDGGKVEIAQSKAIERYISKKTGLFGANDEEAALIDSVCELVNDIKNKYTAAKVDEEKLKEYFAVTFVEQVGYIEKFLAASPSGWVVGDKISQADVIIYHLVNFYFPAEANVAEKLPANVTALVQKVTNNSGIAKWNLGRVDRGEVF